MQQSLFFYKSITLFDKTGDVSIQLADVMGYLMLPALLDTILNEAIGSDEEDESFVEKYESGNRKSVIKLKK